MRHHAIPWVLAVAGGTLRIRSAAGGFDTTIALPAGSWKALRKAGTGYRLKQAGPVKGVQLKAGKQLRLVAKGEALGHSLAENPDPVQVELRLGARRYCFVFPGGRFKAGKRYLATGASVPSVCAPDGSPSGAFLVRR